MLLLLLTALAREPASETVIVEGDSLREAWRAVAHAAFEQGYHVLRRTDDATIFRSETNWKPDLLLFDDGRMVWRRQPPMFVTPRQFFEDGPAEAMARQIFAEGGARSAADAAILKRSTGAGLAASLPLPNGQVGTLKLMSFAGLAAEPKKVRAAAGEVLAALREPLLALDEARLVIAGRLRLTWVPDELYAIWNGPGTPPERHRRLFSFWDSRTDTPEGDAVRAATLAFLRGVVQVSDAPITPEELAELNATREGPTPLVL